MRDLDALRRQYAVGVGAFEKRIECTCAQARGHDASPSAEARRVACERELAACESQGVAASPGAQIKSGNFGIACPVPMRGQLTRSTLKFGAKRRRQVHTQGQRVEISTGGGAKDPCRCAALRSTTCTLPLIPSGFAAPSSVSPVTCNSPIVNALFKMRIE